MIFDLCIKPAIPELSRIGFVHIYSFSAIQHTITYFLSFELFSVGRINGFEGYDIITPCCFMASSLLMTIVFLIQTRYLMFFFIVPSASHCNTIYRQHVQYAIGVYATYVKVMYVRPNTRVFKMVETPVTEIQQRKSRLPIVGVRLLNCDSLTNNIFMVGCQQKQHVAMISSRTVVDNVSAR